MSPSSGATAQRRLPGDLQQGGWPDTQEYHAGPSWAGADSRRQVALVVTDKPTTASSKLTTTSVGGCAAAGRDRVPSQRSPRQKRACRQKVRSVSPMHGIVDGMDDPARQFMRMAVDEAAKSAETDARVGAVLARDGEFLVAGHKNEIEKMHAEEVVLKKAEEAKIDVRGATAFVTLEPCSNLKTKRTCCADLLTAAGISEVYIGRYDINPQINRLGWRALMDNGIKCRDFHADFREELEVLTAQFEGYFLRRDGLTGTAKFDFTQNGGRYDFATDDSEGALVWKTEWTNRGARAIYAYGGHRGVVALARYARDFDEIDDPDALDYGNSSATVLVGGIAVFRNANGHVLCKVLQIEPTADYGGGPHVSVKISYLIRLKDG